MTREEKILQVKQQITKLVNDDLQNIHSMAERAVNGGCLNDEFMADNYLAAKAVLDSWIRGRPHLCKEWKSDFDNIHLFT